MLVGPVSFCDAILLLSLQTYICQISLKINNLILNLISNFITKSSENIHVNMPLSLFLFYYTEWSKKSCTMAVHTFSSSFRQSFTCLKGEFCTSPEDLTQLKLTYKESDNSSP